MSLSRFEHGAVVAELDETVTEIARRMRDFRVGCVVVTRGARPIGIVTDRDLAIRVIAEGRDPRTTRVSEVVTYDATVLPRTAGIVWPVTGCGIVAGNSSVNRLPWSSVLSTRIRPPTAPCTQESNPWRWISGQRQS